MRSGRARCLLWHYSSWILGTDGYWALPRMRARMEAMVMAGRTVIITLEPGTPRLGIWCDGCLTSARCQIDVHAFAGESMWTIATIEKCLRCDGYEDGD